MSRVTSLSQIKKSQKNFQYYLSIFFKGLKIIFRSDRNIKLIHASSQNVLSSNKRIIKYRFRNALWYEFENATTCERVFSIPSLGYAEKRKLIVHGLFRKKTYILNFDDSTKNFCTVERIQINEVENTYVDTAALVRNL